MAVQKTDRVLSCLLIILSGIFIAGGVAGIWLEYQQNFWPTAQGKITDSGVFAHRSAILPTWYVGFEYRIEGKSYRQSDDSRKFGQPIFFFYGDAKRYAEIHFPPGKEVTVRYNSKEPSEAVLIPGIRTVWLSSIPFVGFFLFLAFYFRRSKAV